MAGKNRTLQKLYEEFEILKDRHEKQITKLQSVIEEQGTKIKMLERLPKVDKPIDVPKKSRETVKSVNLNAKNLEDNDSRQLKCNMCEDRFMTLSKLELHIKDKHEHFQAKCCDQCGQKFVTAWRLRKTHEDTFSIVHKNL